MAVLIQRIIDGRKEVTDNIKGIYIDPVFGNNSWAQIVYACDNDFIPTTWNIGDEKTITLSGEYNLECRLQIYDFDHFEKSDGTGTAPMLLGCKEVIDDQPYIGSTGETNEEGWYGMYLRNTVMKNIYDSIPEYLRNNIKSVDVLYNLGNTMEVRTCSDKVFIPSTNEVFDPTYIGVNGYGPVLGTKIAFFTNANARMKTYIDGTQAKWWTRRVDHRSNNFADYIPEAGDSRWGRTIDAANGVIFCFNI